MLLLVILCKADDHVDVLVLRGNQTNRLTSKPVLLVDVIWLVGENLDITINVVGGFGDPRPRDCQSRLSFDHLSDS